MSGSDSPSLAARLRRRVGACAAGLALAWGFAASAQDAVTFRAAAADGYVRVETVWPEDAPTGDLTAEADVEHGVLVLRFSRPVAGDVEDLAKAAAARVALARLDPDGTTLRLALKGPARAHVSSSHNVVAVDILAPGAEDPPDVVSPRAAREAAAAEEARRRADAAEAEAQRKRDNPLRLPLRVRAAEAEDYARILFEWAQPVAHDVVRVDGGVEIVFDQDAAPDMRRLIIEPPTRVTEVAARHRDGALVVALGLADGADVRTWNDDHTVVVDVFTVEAEEPVADVEPEPDVAEIAVHVEPEVDPVPPGGVVRAEVTPENGDIDVSFAWEAPVGAAAFRRGDAIWLVFDADADLDLAELIRGGDRHVEAAAVIRGDGVVAARVMSPPATLVTAIQDGPVWTFVLGEASPAAPAAVKLDRIADGAAPPKLIARLEGATRVLRLPDPGAGDVLAVATAHGPAQGLPSQRAFVEVTLLASAHGLAFEMIADGATIQIGDRGVVVERPEGLALTPRLGAGLAASDLARAPVTPGFIDFAGWSTAPAKFADAHDALTREIAVSENPVEATLALARLLVGHELGAEAVGLLEDLVRARPEVSEDARFRALRGAANVLVGRNAAAEHDFYAPGLSRDKAAAMWRGYLASTHQDWREARRQFEVGRDALYLFREDWQGRFLIAYAHVALALNDLGAAKAAIDETLARDLPLDLQSEAMLASALYEEALGDKDAAIKKALAAAALGWEPIEARAMFEVVRLERAQGVITDEDALERLEALRYRWRGDTTELEIIRELGALYVERGDFRRALSLMRSAVTRFPDDPESRRLATDMAGAYRELFLGGGAGGLDPIQALALWYEFNELTPIGADGDRMIRRLADRLLEFDLLEQASELLRHQVDNRLRGLAKAQVATDLAAIYMMDRRAEDALDVLRDSRLPRLPDDLNSERLLLEARALAEIGRRDHALELLSTERSRSAVRLRADIAWSQKDFANAGPLLERAAGDAWSAPGRLRVEDENFVLRSAVAYGLDGDADGLARLKARYDAKMRDGAEATAWRLVTDRPDVDGVVVKDLARRISGAETLEAFLEDFRARRAPAVDAALAAAAAEEEKAAEETESAADDAAADEDSPAAEDAAAGGAP